ncbi:MAG: putative LPS assembly protein LptD, partial [Acidobacteriota bacterium]
MIIGAGAATPGAGYAQTQSPAQVFNQSVAEIPYRDGKLTIASDYMDSVGDTYHATGHVRITFQDMVITCDGAEYNHATRKGTTSGRTHFSQKKAWFDCSRSEFDLSTQTAKFFDATGYTDEEFYVQGRTVLKTGRDTYSLDQGALTSCQEKRPKWQFSVGTANIHLDQTARLHGVLFKVRGVPLFYFPYLVVPLEEKKRSSGFMPPHAGNSTTKGRQFRLGYYQTLGTSAELTTYGDYFSKRGFGMGGIFNARPNEQTDLHVEAYGVNDRLDQGGAHLLIDGETQFENGFRAAANVNITTNFAFRQVFADGFRSATIPEEQAIVYATRDFDSFSTNFAYDRREVFFPGRSLVIQKSPSIEFASLGKSLGKLPL